MILVDKSDFVGKFQVAQNKYSDLQAYIDRYEEPLFVELMGKTLADDFISNPTDSKWDDLKAVGFGLTSMIVGFIFFEYVRDLPYRMTNQGVVYQQDENATQVITSYVLRQRYNECVRDYKSAQDLLDKDFDDYDGKRKKFMIE